MLIFSYSFLKSKWEGVLSPCVWEDADVHTINAIHVPWMSLPGTRTPFPGCVLCFFWRIPPSTEAVLGGYLSIDPHHSAGGASWISHFSLGKAWATLQRQAGRIPVIEAAWRAPGVCPTSVLSPKSPSQFTPPIPINMIYVLSGCNLCSHRHCSISPFLFMLNTFEVPQSLL